MSRFKKFVSFVSLILALAVFMLAVFAVEIPSFAAMAAAREPDGALPPALYFTDLTSAPAGAYVTVWGMWLAGAEVTVGGVAVAPTDATLAPRIGDNTFAGLDLDKISIKIPDVLPPGRAIIKVVTPRGSAAIDFVIRTEGSIRTLAPGESLPDAIAAAAPGDILYLADGFAQAAPLSIAKSGTTELPIAIIAAPGAAATFNASGASNSAINGSNTTGIVLSQISIIDSVNTALLVQNSQQWRIVGCDIAAPSLAGSGNRGGINGAGANMKILGNNIHNILGYPTSVQPRDFSNIWLQTDGSDIEIAYNFIGQHDGEMSAVSYGIIESGTGVRTNVDIHHNYMYNIFGSVARFTNANGPLGDLRFTSNVFNKIGTMDQTRVSSNSVNVGNGHYAILYIGSAMNSFELVNNTFYNCGPVNTSGSGAGNYNTSAVTVNLEYTGDDLLIANNIIFNKNCRPGGFGATGQRPFTLSANPAPGNYGNMIFAPNQSAMTDAFAAWDLSGRYITWNNNFENPSVFTLDNQFFLDPQNGDLRLADGAQAIDFGERLLGKPGGAAVDYSAAGADGVHRGYQNSGIDAGAFESPISDSSFIAAQSGMRQRFFSSMFTGILTVTFVVSEAGPAIFGVGGLGAAAGAGDLTAYIDVSALSVGDVVEMSIDMVNGNCSFTTGGGSMPSIPGVFNAGAAGADPYISSFYVSGADFELTDLSIISARINSVALSIVEQNNIPRGTFASLSVVADIEGQGSVDVTNAATFVTANSKIAVADAGGVTGTGRGSIAVTALYMGNSDTQTVTVTDPLLASIAFDKSVYYTFDIASFDGYRVIGTYTDGTRFILSAADGLIVDGAGTGTLAATAPIFPPGAPPATATVVAIGTPTNANVSVNGQTTGASLLTGGVYDVVVTADVAGYTGADLTDLLYPSGKYTAVYGESSLTVAGGAAAASFTVADAPVGASSAALFFTDQTHVPAGGYVTVWGDGLGTSRGNGHLTLGARAIGDYLVWGYDPASSRQKISFQVPGDTAPGSYELKIIMDDGVSNALPLVVTDGTILFANDFGNDVRGDGSPDSPYETIAKAWAMLPAGQGVVYAGTPEKISTINRDTAFSLNGGAAGAPRALVAFPGAEVELGGAAKYVIASSPYVTISQFICIDASDSIIETANGARVVGNIISQPAGDGASGSIHGSGNDISILGNLLQGCGKTGSDKLFHTIYIGAPGRGADIGWNRLLDNEANRAIQFNASGSSQRFEDISIHDNLLRNNRGNAVNLAESVGGYAYIYNNIIDYNGAGYDPGTTYGIYVNPDYSNTTVYAEIYNNLLYNMAAGAAIHANNGGNSQTLVYNNIIVQSSGTAYVTPGSTGQVSNNLYFGSTAGTSYDARAIVADPGLTVPGADYDYAAKHDVKISDYAIAVDSPAKGAAVLDGVFARKPETDVNGTARGAFDTIGPWYLVSEGPPVKQSTISPEDAVVDLYPGTVYHKPLEVTVNFNGNSLTGINLASADPGGIDLGSIDLAPGQYAINGASGEIFTFPLSLFAEGTALLTFSFSGGEPCSLALEVRDSDPGQAKTETEAFGRPYIAFSDIVSGPSTGGPGGNGAIVTIWGRNFGDAQSGHSVKIGNSGHSINAILDIPALSLSGGELIEGPSGSSSGEFSGVDANNGFDYISFQLPATLDQKLYHIWVENDGKVSNSILFTVREGTIRYVANNADPGAGASGSGTYESPYNSITRFFGAGNNAPGDITYVVGNFTQTLTSRFGNSSFAGTADMPYALIAYPGAEVKLTSTATNSTLRLSPGNRNIIFSKIHFGAESAFIAVDAQDDESAPGPANLSFIGGVFSAIAGSTGGNTGVFIGGGENLRILGNYAYRAGSSTSARDVFIFLRTQVSNLILDSVEVAYNRVGQWEPGQAVGGYPVWMFNSSGTIKNLSIHDNYFFRTGEGFRFNSSSVAGGGELSIYNNIFDQVSTNGFNSGNAVLVDSGHGYAAINIINNTFYNFPRTSALLNIATGGTRVVANNIFFNKANPGATIFSGTAPTAGDYCNVFVGNTAAVPAWDLSAISVPAADADPSEWFAGAAGGDFTLLDASGVIGTAEYDYPAVAYNGARRPGVAADPGAFQSAPVVVVIVDKSGLAALIAEADLLLADSGKYTGESCDALFDALEAAKGVYEDANASIDGVENTIAELQAAIDGLEPIPFIYITGPDSVASGAGATASYTISAKDMHPLSAIDFSITVDGSFLSSKELTLGSGFVRLSDANYGSELYWTNVGEIWTGRAILFNAAPGGLSGDFDILTMVFGVAEGKLGFTEVKLDYAIASYGGVTISSEIEIDTATTELVQWYSPYDLNKDGVVDLHDLTFALQYLSVAFGDPEWDDAKVADFEVDGVIDIDDLILILANYSIPYYN